MSFRFRPPAVQPSAAAAWVLKRAFGPPRPDATRPPSPTAALDLSISLGLTERCADRQGEKRLTAELDTATAGRFMAARHRAAARAILSRQLAEKTAAVGRELAVPVVLLKGMALLESGATTYGSRPMCDVDVLVAAPAAALLAKALCDRGFRDSGLVGPDFHLPPLLHDGLGTLEIHTRFRDLPASLDAESLARDRLAKDAPEMPGAQLPVASVLAAHTIAHAISQHGSAPSSYPLLRGLADVQDLVAQSHDPELLIAENPLLEEALSARERSAATVLLVALSAGRRPPADSDAGLLLRHALAAAGDARYLSALRARAAVAAVKKGQWRRISRGVKRTFQPPRRRPAHPRAEEVER